MKLRGLRRPYGHAALTRYRAHGSGVDLFRAYLYRRKADQQVATARRQQLIAEMEKPAGLPIKHGNAARAELIMLDVLTEMDGVVRDLLRFCASPGPQDGQLRRLHDALRIGRNRSAYDVKLTRQRWAACAQWVAAYLAMQDTMIYKSERAIAEVIADDLDIGARTVTRYWQQLKEQQPWQAEWAGEIATRAKSRRASIAVPRKRKQLKTGPRRD